MLVRPVFRWFVTLGAAACLLGASPSAPAQNAALGSAAVMNAAPKTDYDANAEALLQRAADRLKGAHSFSGNVRTVYRYPATGQFPARETHTLRTFRMQRPNLAFHEIATERKGADGKWTTTPVTRYISDGKQGAVFAVSDKTYQKLGVTTDALGDAYELNFHEFFDSKFSDAQHARDRKTSGRLASLRIVPDETWGGVACSVVEEKMRFGKTKAGDPTYYTMKIYVGKDNLIRGYHTETPSPSGDGAGQTTDDVVSNLVVGGKIPASAFVLNFAGYKTDPKRPDLLAAGTPAPDFTAYDKNGKAVKLSDFRGKIVVLDFWATWCGPCMQSLPETADVAKENANKGVVVLAVNVWDKKEAFDKWLPLHPEFSPIRFVIDTTPGQGQDVATKQYHVWGIPTQYVVDRNGKIVASLVYRPAAELENALARADAPKTTQ